MPHCQSHAATLAVVVFDTFHDLVDDVDTEATRANLIQIAGSDLIEIRMFGSVQNLDQKLGVRLLYSCQRQCDSPIGGIVVSMTNDIADRLIDSKADPGGLMGVQPHSFAEGIEHSSNHAQIHGAAEELHLDVRNQVLIWLWIGHGWVSRAAFRIGGGFLLGIRLGCDG